MLNIKRPEKEEKGKLISRNQNVSIFFHAILQVLKRNFFQWKKYSMKSIRQSSAFKKHI